MAKTRVLSTPIALGDYIREADTRFDSMWGDLQDLPPELRREYRATQIMLKQAVPVRDELARGVWRLARDDDNMQIALVSQHQSRSILLPVYRMIVPSVGTFYMRNNFFDWKVTALLETDVSTDTWGDLFSHSQCESKAMFEGFEYGWICGSFEKNRRAFSVSLPAKFEYLFTFHFMLRREMIRLGRESAHN